MTNLSTHTRTCAYARAYFILLEHVAKMEERLLQVGGDLSMPIVISSESENSDEEVEPPIDSSFTFTPTKRLVSCCTLRLAKC